MSDKQETAKKGIPGFNSELLNSLPNAFRLWERCIRQDLKVCQPCIVEEYDRESHLAKVRPLVKGLDVANDQTLSGASMVVSVWRWQSGGFLVDAPLFKGDTGWVIASDRDSAKAKKRNASIQDSTSYEPSADGVDDDDEDKNNGPQDPENGTIVTHVASTGFFIPDMWGSIDLGETDGESLVIEQLSKDATTRGKITISKEGVATIGVFDGTNASQVVVNGGRIELVRGDGCSSTDITDAATKETLSFVTGDGFVWDGKVDKEQEVLVGLRIDEGTRLIQAQTVTQKHRGDLIIGESDKSDWNNVSDIPLGSTINGMAADVTIVGGDNISIETSKAKKTIKIVGQGGGGGGENLTLKYGDNEPVVYNGSAQKTFEVPAPTYPVTSVDAKADTYGIDVSPTTGAVKVENTGTTGIYTDQSGDNKYPQAEGTDAVHGQQTVKTKDVKLTFPILQFVTDNNAAAANVIADAVSIDVERRGQTTGEYYDDVTLGVDKSKANCDVHLSNATGTSLGKVFGTQDVNIPTKQLIAGTGISLTVANNQITISATGTSQTSSFTAQKYVMTGASYSSSTHKLMATFALVTYVNGLVTSWTDDAKTEEITTAVQETV